MNKPLLKPHQPRRISLRETALALVALGCAAGWLNERMNNHATAETQQFVDALRELRHNPDMVMSIMVPGDIPISCRMKRFDPGPPPEKVDPQAAVEEKKAVKPPAAAEAPAKVPATEKSSEPKKPVEPASDAAKAPDAKTADAKATDSP